MKQNLAIALLTFCLINLPNGRSEAQTLTALHAFSSSTDGISPEGMVLSGDTIYGVNYANPGRGEVEYR